MLLEVIATSLDDALAAEDGGAGRLEIVHDLERGGLTPPVPARRSHPRPRAHSDPRNGAG